MKNLNPWLLALICALLYRISSSLVELSNSSGELHNIAQQIWMIKTNLDVWGVHFENLNTNLDDIRKAIIINGHR